MSGKAGYKTRYMRWLAGMVILTLAECAGVAAIEISLSGPAQAQRYDDRYSLGSRQRRGGFFQQLFGPTEQQQRDVEHSAPVESSRAPAPRKPDPKAEPVEATTSIVVMGDGMADWLAYGLEDAFADTPEVAIVRKSKIYSGLLRYDAKSDIDWWHAARDILSGEKANYVVMMLGVGDRQNIRERDIAKEAEKKDADKKEADKKEVDKKDADKKDQGKDGKKPAEDTSIVAPEPPPGKKSNGIVEFRSDQWEKVYSRRIDETVAALKSKGVPVFWVGLPSIRGAKSTADAVYLNDLYRVRAERAGAIYIDVWDGFVDEAGKYATYGPDYEGQTRRLRSGDGVFFTKYGARKLAHYVEREVRRYMGNRGLLALPSGPLGPLPGDSKPTARPLAGPVVPLTMAPGNSEELLGGAGAVSARADATAAGVLVKGDSVAAPAGRADDFIWPRGNDAARSAVPAAKPEAKLEAAALPGNPVANPKPAKKPAVKPVNNQAEQRPQQEAPRPSQPVQRSSEKLFGPKGPFGWMR
ncbi:MAG TPA: DUF459 domain-containing protein [Pseudolabrys sp.]|nr:DUF459 domain-containing protein [Pseudolabrys sp.]